MAVDPESDWQDVTDWEPPSASTAIQQPKGSALSRAAGGFWDTTVGGLLKSGKTLYDLSKGIANPGDPDAIQAARDLWDSHVDQYNKAKDAWERGDNTEAFGHVVATVLPMVGPAAAHAGERLGGSPPKFDKYGNVLVPGQAPDVAGGLGEAGGLLTTAVAPEIARATAEVPAKLNVPDLLDASANKGYSQVLGATTKANKFRSQRVVPGYEAAAPDLGPGATVQVPGLIDRGVTAITRKGLAAKINATIQDVGAKLENAWGNIPDEAGRPAAEVYKAIDSGLEDSFMKPDPQGKMQLTGPDAQHGYDFGQSLKEYLKAHETVDPATGQAVIPYKSLKQFRQSWDDLVAGKNGYAGSDLANDTKATAYRASANGLRDILNTDNPTVAALNREYKFWSDAGQVVDDTVSRTSSQGKSLSRRGAKMAGYVFGYGHGGYLGAAIGGAAMDGLESVISSPAWRTVSAVAKSKLADALASGSTTKVANITANIQRAGSFAGAGDRPPQQVPESPGRPVIPGDPLSVTAPDGSVHVFDTLPQAQRFRDLISQ